MRSLSALVIKHVMKFEILFFSSKNDLWIVKPPALNNGHGVHVINGPESLDPKQYCCVQKYIKNPLLLNGLKVR